MENDKTKVSDTSKAKAAYSHKDGQKKPKAPLAAAKPLGSPAPSLLLALVCFCAALIVTLINTFIYPFSDSLLAPLLLQVLSVLFPIYLSMLVSSDEMSPARRIFDMGFLPFKVKHIIFIIFSAVFLMCAVTTLRIFCGNAPSASEGIKLLGTFTAGENDFSVSAPYIILTYAMIPAICEETLFRGMIFSRLKRISLPFALVLSSVLSALFQFDLSAIIPSLFVGAFLTFILYTTGSILPCIIVHTALNIYELYLGSNIAAYFLTGHNFLLLLIVILTALLLSAALFFSEASKVYREKAIEQKKTLTRQNRDSASRARARSDAKAERWHHEKLLDKKKWGELVQNIRSALAYRQNLVFLSVIGAVYVAVVVINFIV